MTSSFFIRASASRLHFRLLLCFFFLLTCTAVYAQTEQLKVMSYNLLNYPAGTNITPDTSVRNPYYRTIVQAAQPDVLVVVEMLSQDGVNGFLSNVMNAQSNTYSAGVFINGFDSDNAIFFKTSKFQFISNRPILTALRNISEFTLKHIASGDTMRFYAVHLKASSGAANEAARADEVDSLRKVTNTLPAGSNFVVCGDFNFYGSTESAYQKLLQVVPGNEGHFYDAITMTGTWNNPAYAPYHTQSPRVRAFGGGSTGGMDDRFDLILYSKGLQQAGGITYVAGTMQAYGNDGNHYNDSINKMPNNAVSADVANALHNAADHIPVMATFSFSSAGMDVGVSSFVRPDVSSCLLPDKTLRLYLRNFGSSSVNFNTNPVTVKAQAINPSLVTTILSKTLSTNVLAVGDSIEVVFDSPYNMGNSGNYLFRLYSEAVNDPNKANDSLAWITVPVSHFVYAGITPSGTVSLCTGDNVVLQADSGVSFLWSNGSTGQFLTVNSSGTFSVTVTDANGCSAQSNVVQVVPVSSGPLTLMSESMGIPSGTTSIATYETANGFDNDIFTMSGSGDVRNTTNSAGYPTATGGGNVFLTNTVGKNFIISGINTLNKRNITLSFGLYKNITTSSSATLLVQYSTDGSTYTNLSVPVISTGTGTSGWFYLTAMDTLPATSNLRLRFQQDGTAVQYRIDDILIKYIPKLLISTSGPTTFLAGDSVKLYAPHGNYYLWSNGKTDSAIVVKSSGNYSVKVDCYPTDTIAVTVNSYDTLHLEVFIQGFYQIGASMLPVLYNTGISSDPTACDSITVDLYSSIAPYNLLSSVAALLHTDGTATVSIPGGLNGQLCYVVVRHRNSIETWSKNPVLISSHCFYSFRQ